MTPREKGRHKAGRRENAQHFETQRLALMGRAAAGLAHDFNNLLQILLGSLETLRDHVTDEQAQGIATAAAEAARRGTALTRQLQALGRKKATGAARFDAAAAIEPLRGLLGIALGPAMRLRFEIEPNLPPVAADPAQFEQCFLNLAFNARDAMDGRGALSVRLRRAERAHLSPPGPLAPGPYVEVIFEDQGPGIDPAILPRIFDPFFTTKAKGKGSGLGLATAMEFARASGGGMQAENRPGGGARIALWLPAAAEPPTPAIPTRAVLPDGQGSGRILLVDDEADLRIIAEAFLIRAGFEVRNAANAEAALALIAQGETFDAVVTDDGMPGMSGAEMAREILGRRPATPILIITGYADRESLRGLPGRAKILRKPFRRDELVGCINALLRERAVRECLPQG